MRWPHMKVDDGLYEERTDELSPEGNHCDHVVSTMTIRWNGDVVPCCFDLTSQHVLRNVLDDSIVSIWNSPAYQELREGIRRRTFIELCSNCNVVRKDVYLIPKFRCPLPMVS